MHGDACRTAPMHRRSKPGSGTEATAGWAAGPGAGAATAASGATAAEAPVPDAVLEEGADCQSRASQEEGERLAHAASPAAAGEAAALSALPAAGSPEGGAVAEAAAVANETATGASAAQRHCAWSCPNGGWWGQVAADASANQCEAVRTAWAMSMHGSVGAYAVADVG